MNSKAKLNIIVALPCEARLLLDIYHLSLIENPSNFQVFSNKDRSIHLIVSGIGKVCTAAAVGYLHAWTGANAHTCYLNIGIAGGFQLSIGSIYLVHKIIDATNNKTFYPTPILPGFLSHIAIMTVEQIQAQYLQQHLLDMEASGFFSTATCFVTQEQVQILKIISDNSPESIQNIHPAMVISLFEKQKESVQRVVDYLLNLSAFEFDQQLNLIHLQEFLGRWHFTNYQQYELRELLRRWQVNKPEINPLTLCQLEGNSKNVLGFLNNQLLLMTS